MYVRNTEKLQIVSECPEELTQKIVDCVESSLNEYFAQSNERFKGNTQVSFCLVNITVSAQRRKGAEELFPWRITYILLLTINSAVSVFQKSATVTISVPRLICTFKGLEEFLFNSQTKELLVAEYSSPSYV